MAKWSDLAPDLKICVTIYREGLRGNKVWVTRLCELLKDDVNRLEISMNEDKLMDCGMLDKQYEKVDGLWTSCYRIDDDALSFVKNVAENLTET